ncbi:MAG: hypothetical protein QXU89_02235 [Desulfurococcaceae archaeon]
MSIELHEYSRAILDNILINGFKPAINEAIFPTHGFPVKRFIVKYINRFVNTPAIIDGIL